MKAYIIYIATLLAALALPANGQTGGIDTKYAPYDPAMPYKFSLVTIGGNNGTVAVEDNNASDGVIFVEKDTLIYGAPGDLGNVTIVKLTVTPNTGYIIRKGYPKAYKTGETEELKYFFNSTTPYTFKMRTYPITVEMAYAHQLKSIDAVTLKEEATDVTAAIALLPGYIPITLEGGRKDSLAVSRWTFKESGNSGSGTNAYVATAGAYNRFTATLATLPDSIADATAPLLTYGTNDTTCTIIVANKTEVLKPVDPDKGIIISGGNGDNLNSQEDENGNQTAFNGTIGNGNTTVKSLEVKDDVKDATLTFNGVTVSDGTTAGTTTIRDGADLTLRIEGSNSLGTLTIEPGATIVLDKTEDAKLENTTVSNGGIFRDSTATITTVTGSGKLSIDGSLTGGGSVNLNTKVALTASCTDKAGITSFIWQKRNADGSYTEVQKKDYNADGTLIETKSGEAFNGIKDSFEPATSSNGSTEYRCLIERTVTTTEGGGNETTATTLLSTQPAKVEVKSGGSPIIPATYYTITLPALEGFTSNPAPGQHSVEEGYSFSFSLTPVEGNTASAPVVATSRGETIKPRQSDGKYVITGIYENITITFTSLPTANEAMVTESIRIQSVAGAVYIQTPQPATTVIYNLSGQLVKMLNLSAGDSRIELSKGIYIIRIGSLHQKVIVR